MNLNNFFNMNVRALACARVYVRERWD